MDGFWMFVLGGVVVGIFLTIATATGRRVRSVLSTLPAKLEDRRRKAQKAKDDEALNAVWQEVRDRSETLDIDLPWSLDHAWRGPGVSVIWRSGIAWFHITPYEHGLGQYEAALKSGKVPRDRTTTKAAPRVVEQWTLEELEGWLQKYPLPDT
jgi:hypothetical protein